MNHAGLVFIDLRSGLEQDSIKPAAGTARQAMIAFLARFAVFRGILSLFFLN